MKGEASRPGAPGPGRSPGRVLVGSLALAVAWYGAALVGDLFSSPSDGVTVFAPAFGVALAAVALWGWEIGFGVLLGSLAFDLTDRSGSLPFPLSAAVATGAALQTWLSAGLLRRAVGELPPAPVRLVLRAIVLLGLASWLTPLVAATSLAIFQGLPATKLPGVTARLWLGVFVGLLACAPGLIVAGRRWRRQPVSEPLAWALPSALTGLALLSFAMTWTQRDREVVTRLRTEAREMAEVLRHAVDRPRHALNAVQALFDTSVDIGRDEFRRFAAPLLEDLPATGAIGWAPRVRAAERRRFEESVRSSDLSSFSIFEFGPGGRPVPAAARPELFPATFFEPFEPNLAVLGFDEASEARRREALESARDTGLATLSPPLPDTRPAPGRHELLLFRPVYRHDATTDTVPARRANLAGMAFSSFRLEELAKHALRELAARDIELSFFDTTGGKTEFLAFLPSTSGPQALPVGLVPDPIQLESDPFHYSRELEVYGRTWKVVARPGPAYVAAVRGPGPWLRLAAGLAVAGAFLLYSAVRQRAEARLAEAERKYRTLVEQTPAIVYLDEVGGNWRYVSPKVEEVLGYAPEDFLDRRVRWLECIHEDDRERVWRATRGSLSEGASILLEYRVRTRDGRLVWIRDEAEPTREPGSGIWLLRGVMNDVTDRKHAEAERQALLEVMQGLASTPEPKEFLQLVHAALRRVLYAENFFVLLHDPATGLFESLYWVDQHDAAPSRLDLGRGCGAYVFRSGEAIDMTAEVFAGLEARGEAEIVGTSSPSWLGAPLKKGGRSIGVMAVQDYETPGRYSERDRDFLALVAAQVALAIEREQSEEAVRRSEAKYRLVSENAGDGIWTLDVDSGRFTFYSPAAERLFGRAPRDLVGKPISNLLTPADAARAAALLAERACSPERPPDIDEFDHVREDGTIVPAEVKTSWVVDDSGRLQVVGVTRDITDRRRAERESEALYRIVQGAVTATGTRAFVHLVHEALRPVLRAESLFIVLRDPRTGLFQEIHQSGDSDPTPAEPAQVLRDRSALVLRAGEAVVLTPASFEAAKTRNDVELHPGPLPASWLGAPLGIGADAIGVLAVQDHEAGGGYSERDRVFLASVAAQVALALGRRKAQDALAQNEARLREAHQIAHVGVWELDPSDWSFSLSDEGCQILGLPPREGRFRQDEIFSVVHPEDRESVRQAVLDSLASDRPTEVDHRLLLPGGRVRWVKGRWRTELGADGMAVHATGTVQDLTEQLLAREAKSLAAARDAAVSANRAKSVFLASMSHEIRTPMNSILGFSQLLLGDPALSPRHREQVGAIIRSGGHLLDLINDVLEMSRIEAGRTHVEPAETDLQALLHDLEATFRIRVGEKGLSFHIERCADLPGHVLTDEKKLRQILMNLVGNAVKFTSKGTVNVRVRTEPAESEGLLLLVDVEDTGPGIPAEDLPRLFQRFEQTRVGREASTGTGLGLAISRAFARLMGGDVTVSSRVGEGSVFGLVLPVSAVETPASVEPVEARRVTGLPDDETRRRILVADDVDENREILRQMLGRVGFEVSTAGDGAEAVRIFSEWHPDLVLMDLRMPGTGGLEATRTIRALEGPGRVPIVAVTASAFEDDRQDVADAGGDAFVSKPFREAELLWTVGRLLGLRYVFEGDPVGSDPLETRSEAHLIPGPLRDDLRSAVVSADLDRVLGLADEAARDHPSAAKVVRDLAERFEYDRLLTYLGKEC